MDTARENFLGDHFLFTSGQSSDKEEDDDDPDRDSTMPQSVKEDGEELSKRVNNKRSQRKDKGKTRFTAYILWARDVRPTVSKENPSLSFIELNRKLGELWKQVSTNQKYEYKLQAMKANSNIQKRRIKDGVAEMKNGSEKTITKRLKTSHEDCVNGEQQHWELSKVMAIGSSQVNNSNDDGDSRIRQYTTDIKQSPQECIDVSESENEEDSHDEPCGAIKCKQPSGENLNWVQCDGCDAWFHYSCVGMMPSDALEDDQEYMCLECTNHVTLPKILGDNSCPLCGLIYENKQILKLHLSTHANEPRYTCIDCGKGFLRSCQLVVHQRIHTGERPYVCAVCEQTFISASHLHIHRQNKHSVKKDRELGPNAVSEFWASPGNKEVLLAVKNKELDLKAAAAKLSYSYRFTYSRYKEEFGNILHNTPGKRKKEIQDFWKNPLGQETLLRVKQKEIGMKTAAELLNCTYEFTYARYREIYGKIRKPNFNPELNQNGATSSHSMDEDSPGKAVLKIKLENGMEDSYKETQNQDQEENEDKYKDQEQEHEDMDQYQLQALESEEDCKELDHSGDLDHSMIKEGNCSDHHSDADIDIDNSKTKTEPEDSDDPQKLCTMKEREEEFNMNNEDAEISLTQVVALISATKLKIKTSHIIKRKDENNKFNEGDKQQEGEFSEEIDKVNNLNNFNEHEKHLGDDQHGIHSKQKNIKKKVHRCSYCDYESESRHQLAVHLRNHTMKND